MTKLVITIPWLCLRLTTYNRTQLTNFTSCRTATSNSDFQVLVKSDLLILSFMILKEGPVLDLYQWIV